MPTTVPLSLIPVRKAREVLRAVHPVWNEIFRPDRGGPLTWPGLPSNIYYFMPSASWATSIPRCEHGSGSFCLHYEHLNITPSDEVYAMLSTEKKCRNLEHGDRYLDRWCLISTIMLFWDTVRALPAFEDKTPNIFFVDLKE